MNKKRNKIDENFSMLYEELKHSDLMDWFNNDFNFNPGKIKIRKQKKLN